MYPTYKTKYVSHYHQPLTALLVQLADPVSVRDDHDGYDEAGTLDGYVYHDGRLISNES